VFHTDPDRVCGAIDEAEVAGDDGRGNHGRRTHRAREGRARVVERMQIAADHGIGECKQFAAVLDAAVTVDMKDTIELDVQLQGFATLTEDMGVPGGSVKTLVQRGHPRRDEFDLRARQGRV